MIPKPIKPCFICGFSDWWLRKALGPDEWICGVCHPNPNIEEEIMGKEYELINGHFVVKEEKKVEEVKPKEQVVIKQKEYSEEVLLLRERVINGNQKLFTAWEKLRAMVHDTEEWSKQMERWHEATEKLSLLCGELKLKGYDECLYIVNGQKVKSCLKNPGGFWCQVCPSSYRYWEKEIFD